MCLKYTFGVLGAPWGITIGGQGGLVEGLQREIKNYVVKFNLTGEGGVWRKTSRLGHPLLHFN